MCIALPMINRRLLREVAGGILAIFGAFTILTGLGIFPLLPRVYEARALVKFHKESAALSSMPSEDYTTFAPDSFSRALETIQSKIVLFTVISNMSLTSRYVPKSNPRAAISVPEAYRILRQHLRVGQFRSTSLIEIVADSADRHEAADLAGDVAVAFRNHMLAQRRDAYQASIEVLDRKLHTGQNDPADPKAQLLNRLRTEAAALTSPVEIMELPETPVRPSRPSSLTTLSLVIAGTFLLLLGAARISLGAK